MHWILHKGFFSSPGWDALLETLARFGIPHSLHDVVPRIGALRPEPAFAHRNVVCFGSTAMRHEAVRNGWSPGVFDVYAQDFEQQRAHWGAHLLNAGSVVCSVRDATFDAPRMFVRPVDDSKAFAGRVFDAEEFAAWRRTVCDGASGSTSLTPGTRIQLAPAAAVFAEYRCWVVDGEVVTWSQYRRGGQPFATSDVDARLIGYVRERIAEWTPHRAFVIDVCDTADGIRIVEINTLSASAFYAADVQKLVLALEDAFST